VTAPILVGTAGWTLPKPEQAHFPAEGSHLTRYAARFPVAEINSSFHRPHRASTWARWADEVPPGFRFSAKLPKTITHQQRLAATEALLDTFLAEAGALGDQLACLLVQLPPSLELDPAVAARFFAALGERTETAVACEPRHPSWFTADADALLAGLGVARVAADPARVPEAAEPGGARDLVYHRCTARRGCTTRRTTGISSPAWPIACARTRRVRARCGASSTTPRPARPRETPSISST